MINNFRNLKIGFVNLVMDLFGKDVEDKALKIANDIKSYLNRELGVSIIESEKLVKDRYKARSSWKLFKNEDIDAVIIFNGTFSTGEIAAEIIRNIDLPFLIWGVEEYSIDKHSVSGSMIGLLPQGTIFSNFGKRFSFIYGNISNSATKEKIKIFINAVRAISYLKESSIGVIGMRPDGFEISDFDELSIKNIFGTTITKISMSNFKEVVKNISEKEIDKDMIIQQEIFDIEKKELEESRGLSRVYLALREVIKNNNIQSYAPDCWPEFRDIEKMPLCPANGRLNSEGIMASCECDVNGALSLMLLYSLTKSTPWLADFVNYIEKEDALLFFHGGNCPYNICDKKPKIQRVFGGLSEVSVAKPGMASVLRLHSVRGEYKIHIGVGEVVRSKLYVKGSNMMIRMKNGNMNFVESLLFNGIPHHNAIVYSDITNEVKEFANLLSIPVIVS